MGCAAAAGVTCMDVAMALSLVISEVAAPPFNGRVMTFDDEPRIVDLKGTQNALASRIGELRRMPWGGSTNFYKTFEELLRMEEQPARVFVFSDMNFNSAAGGRAETDFERAA